MPTRHSEYKRLENDTYVTPQWVWDTLYEVEPWAKEATDPCPVNYTDSVFDICARAHAGGYVLGDIATNTPYGKLGPEIVRAILPVVDRAAFLFPANWDCAKGRKDLLNDNHFHCKYVLTRRITWDNLEDKATPSGNHAWYVWDKGYDGPALMKIL